MIGTGRSGVNSNLRTLLGMKNVRIVAVCDVDRLRMGFAKRMVDQHYGNSDCKSFGDFREAMNLADLDAVMIDAEAGHRVNSQCLLGLAAIKAGNRLEWDPTEEKITNNAQAEKEMKKSFHRQGWELQKFL